MATVVERAFPDLEVGIDRFELERTIQDAFAAALGEEEVVDVHVSRFPHEYGAIVLLRHEPSPEALALALEQEGHWRAAGIRIGILVRSVKRGSR